MPTTAIVKRTQRNTNIEKPKSLLESLKEQLQVLKKERDKFVNDYEIAHKGFCQEIEKTRTILEDLHQQKDGLEREFANKLKLKDQKIAQVSGKVKYERSSQNA